MYMPLLVASSTHLERTGFPLPYDQTIAIIGHTCLTLIACLLFVLTITKVVPSVRVLGVLSLATAVGGLMHQRPDLVDHLVDQWKSLATGYLSEPGYEAQIQRQYEARAQAQYGAGYEPTLQQMYEASTPFTEAKPYRPQAADAPDDAQMMLADGPVSNLTTADGEPCVDQNTTCAARAAKGECTIVDLRKASRRMHKQMAQMLLQCPVSCSSCHIVRRHRLQPVGSKGEVLVCGNKHIDCGMWAKQGECSANPSYMVTSCARACGTCHMLDYRTRCTRLPEHQTAAVQNGDIDMMFSRLANGADDESSPFHRYDVKVLSRPPEGPWLIQLENLLSQDDAEVFSNLTEIHGAMMPEIHALQPDGRFTHIKSNLRTSYNSWCKGHCLTMPATRRLAAAIEGVTGVAEDNYEFLQILRYRQGHYYKHHHEYVPSNAALPCGVRVYTLHIYLNDLDDERDDSSDTVDLRHVNGGTQFDLLNITVRPKRGRAILWSSVHNDEVTQIDNRTNHQQHMTALAVTGRRSKYAINAFIHPYNFRHYYNFACTDDMYLRMGTEILGGTE